MINGLRLLSSRNNAGPITIQRATQPTQNAYGGFSDEVPSGVVLDPCVVHTISGRDLEQVPEADRNKEIIAVYSTSRLYAADGGQAADVVPYKGRDYRVIKVEDYDDHAGVWVAWAALEVPS